jgi:N-acetylmuramoyl-L-alanine amidase
MVKSKTSVFPIYLITIFLIGIFIFPATGLASSGKQKYLSADSYYKKLRNSSVKRAKSSEWLNCINRYGKIYRTHPTSPWAPAGMYKAAQLYVKLAKISGKEAYKYEASDLLTRLRNKYSNSAYARRAKAMPKSINFKEIKHIQSKKKLTKNDKLIKKYYKILKENKIKANNEYLKNKYNKDNEVTDAKPVPPEKSLAGDGVITDLRFWSNPEYTRIVVNSSRESYYSHRLLKKDPDINKPFERLYIDIDQSKLGKGVAEHTAINDHLLNQARAGQYLPHTVRVVIDIKSFENYKIFSLKDPFRIVIDVWGKGSGPAKTTKPKVAIVKSQKPVKTSRITTDNLKSSDIARQLALGVQKIVIDPGHGGSDPGAPGYYKNEWEKDIVLKLSKKLAKTLRDRLQCTVLLTRSTDKKLTLEERTAIANTKRADLFISLHCNAAKNKKLKGIETYILNLATDDKAIAVAARENATSKKNISDLEYILSDLMKHAKIKESTRLAGVVHNSFVNGMKKKYSGINNLGVKQAPFYVLLGARMPSILIETSFISHKTEGKRLLSDSYQTAISDSIADGVVKYINETNPKQL